MRENGQNKSAERCRRVERRERQARRFFTLFFGLDETSVEDEREQGGHEGEVTQQPAENEAGAGGKLHVAAANGATEKRDHKQRKASDGSAQECRDKVARCEADSEKVKDTRRKKQQGRKVRHRPGF